MNVVIRADASLDIGTGHVMRCLTLANVLSVQGAICTFICRAHVGHLADYIMAAGHAVYVLPLMAVSEQSKEQLDDYTRWLGADWQEDAAQTLALFDKETTDKFDWLVVDHYGLDARWETLLRARVKQILVIDDLANRPHDCDLLLDQNLGRKKSDYSALVNTSTQCLIGPKYALLRPEFAEWRDFSLSRRERPVLQHILVTMGGVDKDNATGQVLEALSKSVLPQDCCVTVVMGSHSPWLDSVSKQAANSPYECVIKTSVSNMAELMAHSDLAIGAAGSTSWERCCLGLASIALVLAENQRSIAEALSSCGAVLLVEQPVSLLLVKTVELMVSETDHLGRLSAQSLSVCDGLGVFRVTSAMLTAGD